jgi:hypothetical protein
MKEMKTRLRWLVAYQTRPGRWWYLPFFLVQGGLGLVNTVGEYRVPLGWTYLAVALIYLLQMMWPSVLGWWGAMVAWFAAQFVAPLNDRFVYDIPGYTITFLLLWSLAPLVLLCCFTLALLAGLPRNRVLVQTDSLVSPGSGRITATLTLPQPPFSRAFQSLRHV